MNAKFRPSKVCSNVLKRTLIFKEIYTKITRKYSVNFTTNNVSFICFWSYSFHFTQNHLPSSDSKIRYALNIYTKPYTRIAPYLVGLILGYIISYKYSITGIYRKVRHF